MTVIVRTDDGDVELFAGECEIRWEVDEEWAKAHHVAVALLPSSPNQPTNRDEDDE